MSPTSEEGDKSTRETKQSSKALNPPDDQAQELEDLLLDTYKKTKKDKQQNPAASNED